MEFADILKVGTTVIVSLGGSGLIVFSLSSWLGKIWAERLMTQERASHEQQLAELRSRLEKSNQEELSKLKTGLEIYRDTYLKDHNDKLAIYRLAIDVISDFLADMSLIRLGQRPEGNVLDRFNRGRLKAHGYLAMLAPQKVMNAYDKLIDHIFETLEQGEQQNSHEQWKETRMLAYALLNEVRRDVGIDKSEVDYHGTR